MTYVDNNDKVEGASSFNGNNNSPVNIDPRDSYSDRFEVTSRQTSSSTPRPAVIVSDKHIKNKDRIFTDKHMSSEYGGTVDMASVAKAAEKISADREKRKAEESEKLAKQPTGKMKVVKSKESETVKNDATSKESDRLAKSSNTNSQDDMDLYELRSSGLDSLFAPSVNYETVAKPDDNIYQKDNDAQQDNGSQQQLSEDDKSQDAPKSKNVYAEMFKAEALANKNIHKEPVLDTESPEFKKNPAKAATEQFRKLRQERSLQVVRPLSYNSAKEISSALSAGDAVVLVLAHVNKDLSKRILDFSFGAASMCGARVSNEGKNIFAFTVGQGLTQRERLLCIKQGIAIRGAEAQEEHD